MGMNEIDHTIYPYTVGREDCKVLPRSFKLLAEAEAYLAELALAVFERLRRMASLRQRAPEGLRGRGAGRDTHALSTIDKDSH